MNASLLHEFHHSLGACFAELNGAEIVTDFGDWQAEHAALRETAGVMDLSFHSRLCLVGADRARFLHGQVTNDVKKLHAGEGCYAAITTAKGKMESDVNIFCLADELLLDFEPGLSEKITARFEKFIVADDVQIVDAAPHYGLLSVQGPRAAEVIMALGLIENSGAPAAAGIALSPPTFPAKPFVSLKISDANLGDIYLATHARLFAEGLTSPAATGFDLFVPNPSLGVVADKLIAAAKKFGGRAVGWSAWEATRIEAGIPRFGADMDETNLPLECGIASRAVVFNKGCYLGQEIINRIHSFGHVTKELRRLRLADDLKTLPPRGEKLFIGDKEVGYLTSATKSPLFNGNLALGYVRREANQTGTQLNWKSGGVNNTAIIL